ncbi:hypothetical protein MHPYR_610009 [uncultured Mycobacterium sp.]|uniref:Uncharacterized protein n=1 Tax=uncultured Mycobacterium sp. TaxID=171292 RepID=A0A1Y5PN78_9MYCO|nr:hypothetical protein MHPYR_610009 [uncultured Mycobacterium sp.]
MPAVICCPPVCLSAGLALGVFPTLGLPEQTYRTWQRDAPVQIHRTGGVLAHIRDTEDIHSDDLGR